MTSPRELYIDLLLRSLSGTLSDSVLWRTSQILKAKEEGYQGRFMISLAGCQELLHRANLEFADHLKKVGKTAEEVLEMDGKQLFDYLNWMNPIDAPHTMCGEANLVRVRECVEDVLENDVPGDFVETGVWKGGMTVLMRGILKAHGVADRKVWVADSFAGLPIPDPRTYLKDALFYFLMAPLEHLAIPFEYVEGLFQRYDLLDDQVHFLKGWFCDTLPKADIEKLALVRLDGDLYESTYDALVNLYPKLSLGGYLIIDDYGVPCGCRQAVDLYRSEHGIKEEMISITDTAVYWQRASG
jgi:macrocin-O-methyltransferase TylF-like protien